MAETICEGLSRGRNLLEKGKYRAALRAVEPLREQEGVPLDDRLAVMLLESQLRVKLRELDHGLRLVTEILQLADKQKMPLLIVDALAGKAEICWLSGKLDEGLLVVEEGERLLANTPAAQVDEEQVKRRRGEVLHQKGIINWFKGDLDKALECHQQSLAINEELGNNQAAARSLNNLGLVFTSKGELDQALKYHERSLEYSEALDNKREIAVSLNNLGNVCNMKGELDQGLAYYQRSLVIREELGIQQDTATTLMNIGVVFQLKGELDQALAYYQRSRVINEAWGLKQNLALSINNVGSIHDLKGDLDQALAHFHRSLALYEEIGAKQEIAMVLNNMAEIHWKKGNSEDAVQSFQRSLAIYEELGNNLHISLVLFNLVQVAVQREDMMLVQQYLQELHQITEHEDNRIIDQRYRVAKALSLKASERTRHKIKAVEILEQVVEEEVSDHSLTVTAMIHLCDLLLAELKMTGEDELFTEIKGLTSRLLDIAEQQSSHSLLAETYLLQSKLALIELDMGQARKLLTKARVIAEEKGLQLLARAVGREHDLLSSRLRKWESLIKQNPSKQEMIDLTRLDYYLDGMIRKTATNLLARLHEDEDQEGLTPPLTRELQAQQETAREQKRETVTPRIAYLKSGTQSAKSERSSKSTLLRRIDTGCQELDDLLLGGIPRDYAVILTAPSCDERDLLIRLFLETGARNGEVTFHLSAKTTGLTDLVAEFPSEIVLFLCNPQAGHLVENVPNIIKLKGLENLTAINIALTSAIRRLTKPLTSPRRICIEVISDILLQHHTAQTRRWLNALIPQLKSNGFTTLAVLDSEVHSPQEVRTIAGVFEGEITINKRGAQKLLKVEKMTTQKYLESELLLKKE